MTIKVRDVAFVRFAAPDLDKMATFLSDFGLAPASRSDGALYVRGSDPDPWLHETVRGEAGFRGVGFDAASEADLRAAAQLEGASAIEPLEGPGGGSRVHFSDPDGYRVEVVHGRAPAEPLPLRRARPYNWAYEYGRRNELQRVPRGPAQVKRLGHLVLRVSDFRASEAWYKQRFGFLSSDEVYLGDPGNVITAFMRCDRGEEPSDHHSFLCVGVGEVGFDHAAFEVTDLDAVMVGHEHLRDAGYQHAMGVGRHILGSQIYDYWRDPWGHMVEHFTDGDLLDAHAKTGTHDPAAALGSQWGTMKQG